MKELDFLPEWYRSSRRRRRDLAVRLTCLCVLVAAMVAWSARSLTVLRGAERDLVAVEEAFQSQNTLLEQHVALEARLAELANERALQRQLRGGLRVKQVLSELSGLMPEAMALTDVNWQREQRLPLTDIDGRSVGDARLITGGIEIEGLAASHVDVGSFLAALDHSPCFRQVEMKYSKPVVQQNHEARGFRLVSRIPRFE